MAHELTATDSMMTAIEKPWHGLGVTLDHAAKWQEAAEASGLAAWTVVQQPLITINPKGVAAPVADFVANVRSDNNAILGVVGADYQPVQNLDGFKFLDELLGSGEVLFESAGSLKGGRLVWALARVAGTGWEVSAGDRMAPYVLFSNAHDGTQAVRVLPTLVRVVCWNTLSAALARGDSQQRRNRRKGMADGQISLRHTGDMNARLAEVREALMLTRTFSNARVLEARKLVAYLPSKAQADEYIEALFPTESEKGVIVDRRAELIRDWHTCPRNNVGGVKGTAWGLYNAVSEWVDHRAGRTAEGRFESALLGERARLKAQAWSMALDMAK